MVSFGVVQKRQFKLIDTGEYVFTLNDVGEISGDYGDRMQWDFLVADKATPTEYLARDDGKERILRFFTDPEINLGSRQHEWLQALTGRTLGEGDELPDGDELLGKRMIAYLTHYTPKKGKNAGVAREDVVAGSAKPFRLPGQKANGTAKAAPKATPSEDTVDRDALVAEIKRQIKRAAIADVDSETIELWQQIDLAGMTDAELADGLDAIKSAILAAQEG